MGIVGWIVLGLLAGWIAGLITGRRGQGCVTTMAVGILGALVGGVLANAAGYNGTITDLSLRSVVIAVLGAVLLLFLFNALSGRRR
ncbi:MAG TPA: GlsB/YeaQ/YmgE family stress response membrane protein [Acidimicrobiales bacterium]|nr:GlsB/YeaQ/YmgE family stress response membrane protein [Acidimicrobiales bacterium]